MPKVLKNVFLGYAGFRATEAATVPNYRAWNRETEQYDEPAPAMFFRDPEDGLYKRPAYTAVNPSNEEIHFIPRYTQREVEVKDNK